jgi:trimethylamine---corrinoid protein Co-methyltransferase
VPAATLNLLGPEDCARLHGATLTVLQEVGVEILQDDRALTLFAEAGASVEGRRVRLAPELVEAALGAAPRSWTLKARGGAHDALVLADGRSYFGNGQGCPYLRDPDTRERRPALLADLEGIASACERLAGSDFVMMLVSAEDAPPGARDLAAAAALLRGTRKPLLLTPMDGRGLAAIQRMAAVCGEKDSFAVLAMPAPPLRHDSGALSKLIACAELRVPLIYGPAPSAGSTSPRSGMATVVVANAEVLSGLVLHQFVRPGAPFVYGAGGGATDMRTAGDPYTVPDLYLSLQAGCDLARFYGLPSYSYLGLSVSKALDGQWSAEMSLTTALGALTRGTLLHGFGGLENGMQASYESIVLGAELVGYAKAFLREVPLDDYALALAEIAAAGPGGNHLGSRYTRRHYREFWSSELFDDAGYERWSAAGSLTLLERVRAEVARLRSEPRAFALSAEQEAELEAIVAEELAACKGR